MFALAQAAATGQAPGFYRYKVGDITVTAINDGFFRRPLEASCAMRSCRPCRGR